MKPNWVVNETKYNLAKNKAKNPNDEKEIKAIYVSYGGKLAFEEEVVLQEVKEEIKMEDEKVIGTDEIVSEVVEEEIEEEKVEEIIPEIIEEEVKE